MKQRCRCCLTTNAEMYFDIFGQYKSGITYAENIRYLAEVQVEHNDGLPQQICSSCCNEFHHIYEFGMNIRLADEKLRQDLMVTEKNHIEEADRQMENDLDNEYFSQVDESVMQVCVIEEILEQEAEQEDVIVEEIHEVEELSIMEELLDVHKESKENLLVGLAQVASTQENVNITENTEESNEEAYFPEDELDDNYLIEFNENEINSYKPLKWKCGECKLILRGDVSYEGHMNMHKQLRPHHCSDCQTQFRCRSALKRHKELRHSKDLKKLDITRTAYSCAECSNSFLSSSVYKLHEIIVHSRGAKCPFECDFIENSSDNLREHVVQMHSKQLDSLAKVCYTEDALILYQCYKCSETFEKQALLEGHSKMCQFVEEQHLQEETLSLENDANMEEPEDLYQCKICRRKLLKKNLNKHMELHKRKENMEQQETRKFLCAFCHIHFTNIDDLYNHISEEHYRLVHECQQCNESFSELKNLKEHEKKVHAIKRVFKCEICNNNFRGQAQLSAHKRLHKKRPFKCDQCDKSYPRNVELQIHMRTHTGELPYECHLCDKRFAIKVHLTYHLQKHEGVKHACTYCSAVYDNRNKLKAHLFKHTGMPYKCEMCPGLGFERRIRFANHMQKFHQKTLSKDELAEIFAKNTGKTVHFKNPES